MIRKLTTSEFINNAIKVHGDTFDYSLVNYKGNKIKVSIICKKHGVFEQKPNNHLSLKQGCPSCKTLKHSKRITKNFSDFLTQSSLKYGDKFIYDEKYFKGFSRKTKILCKEHGFFEQTPYLHITLKYGCPQCAIQESIKLPVHLRHFVKKVKCTIQQSYFKNNFTKKSKTYKILGCSWEFFKQHLENNPYGFTINQSNIDLDHIVPLSSAKTEEDVLKINHYKNFQLLPSVYNRNIKKAKPFNRKHFENWLKNITCKKIFIG